MGKKGKGGRWKGKRWQRRKRANWEKGNREGGGGEKDLKGGRGNKRMKVREKTLRNEA